MSLLFSLFSFKRSNITSFRLLILFHASLKPFLLLFFFFLSSASSKWIISIDFFSSSLTFLCSSVLLLSPL